jgi:hypothetical protein
VVDTFDVCFLYWSQILTVKKYIFVLVLALFVFLANFGTTLSAVIPTPIPENNSVNSFELFWPISPGKVMGERFYALKLFKEKIWGFFIFGDYPKADYNVTLSEKRVVEAEKLFKDRKFEDAKKTLLLAEKNRESVLEYYTKAKNNGLVVDTLAARFTSSLDKQAWLISYLESVVPNDRTEIIQNDLKQIKDLQSNFSL